MANSSCQFTPASSKLARGIDYLWSWARFMAAQIWAIIVSGGIYGVSGVSIRKLLSRPRPQIFLWARNPVRLLLANFAA